MSKRGFGKAKTSGAGIKKGSKAGLIQHTDEYEKYFGEEARMAKKGYRKSQTGLKVVETDADMSLGVGKE